MNEEKYKRRELFKETVCLISTEPSFKESPVRFSTVTFTIISDKGNEF